jgi:hypothetical protein
MSILLDFFSNWAIAWFLTNLHACGEHENFEPYLYLFIFGKFLSAFSPPAQKVPTILIAVCESAKSKKGSEGNKQTEMHRKKQFRRFSKIEKH